MSSRTSRFFGSNLLSIDNAKRFFSGADHFDMMTDAPLENGDGLNYINKRASIGIGVNTAKKLGEGEDA